MKRRKIIIRAVALLLAVLIGLGAFGIVFSFLSASAADESLVNSVVQTGDDPSRGKWPLFAGLAALLVIVVLVVVPMLNKKK